MCARCLHLEVARYAIETDQSKWTEVAWASSQYSTWLMVRVQTLLIRCFKRGKSSRLLRSNLRNVQGMDQMRRLMCENFVVDRPLSPSYIHISITVGTSDYHSFCLVRAYSKRGWWGASVRTPVRT
jgi:hypothetical protein